MKTSQSFGIHFILRRDWVKDGKGKVYACITVNKEKRFIALQQEVELKCWDERRGIGKGGRPEIISVNNYLEEVRLAVGNCYQAFSLKESVFLRKRLKMLSLEQATKFIH